MKRETFVRMPIFLSLPTAVIQKVTAQSPQRATLHWEVALGSPFGSYLVLVLAWEVEQSGDCVVMDKTGD